MSDIKYFTQEGLDKLKAELEHLKYVERPNITKDIAEARDKEIYQKMQNMMQQERHKEC